MTYFEALGLVGDIHEIDQRAAKMKQGREENVLNPNKKRHEVAIKRSTVTQRISDQHKATQRNSRYAMEELIRSRICQYGP